LGRGLEALLGRIPPADAGDGSLAALQQPADGPYGGRA